MEYFILEKGEMWDAVLEILERKAKEGVDVRVMYDGTCEVALVPRGYAQQLEKLGIRAKAFAPLMPFLSTHYNYRDHRKILVIDGHTAFTGGINLADEYANLIERFGHWKDTAVRLEGEGVWGLTEIFLEMWELSKEKENIVPLKRFIPPTVDEVSLYCFERHNHVNAQKFVDYYSSNGWKVGKNPMKDWKAAVRTWERSEFTEKDYQYEKETSGLPY